MARIIFAAGLTPWPKLFHNLRASRQTELAQHFPEHVVCQWIGNSQPVAREHDLRVTDGDFTKAATLTTTGAAKCAAPFAQEALQNAQQTAAAPCGPETTKSANHLTDPALCLDQSAADRISQSNQCPALDSNQQPID